MGITLVGVNHRTAPIEVRERLTWPRGDVHPVLAEVATQGASAAVLLSTCNRVEFYLADASDAAVAAVWRLSGERLGVPAEPLSYLVRDNDAVRHLFRVAAGLDSMVLGESEIQGQVREAWERSRDHAGPVLTRLFQHALRVGGRVRSETALSAGAASVPSASIDLARTLFGELTGRHALVLGSGAMAELAVACLTKRGVRTTVAAYRNHERAHALASRFGSQTVASDAAWSLMVDVDLLICATAAPHPVVTTRKLEGVIARRAGRPLCILDISVPRGVLPDVGQLNGVILYDVDDLDAVVEAGVDARRKEIPAAERIVQAETGRFWAWLRGREAKETITALRHRLEAVGDQELQATIRKLDHLRPSDTRRIAHLTRTLVNRFLHEPTQRLQQAAGDGSARELSAALAFLFDLETKPSAEGEDNE